MKKGTMLLAASALALSLSAAAPAWEGTIVASDETAADATERLVLPETAADQARESAARGLNTANTAREQRREFGQARASDARQQRRDAAVGAGHVPPFTMQSGRGGPPHDR